MKRYFNTQKFKCLCTDFEFMFKKIKDYKGELDLRLRDNYFNLYYKGNSLAKVVSRKNDYEISIHKKFVGVSESEKEGVFKSETRFKANSPLKSEYCSICCNAELLPVVFQNKYLNKMSSNIKKVNYSEEITFEQMLITDNSDRSDLVIIDRQVTETGMPGKLDLLGLRQAKGNHFCFEVIEVKLGNNKELAYDVGEQLTRYIKHIESNIKSWAHSYKEMYRQVKMLGLFEQCPWDVIEIVSEVKGIIVVGGYSGIAKESIKNLRKHYPKLKINLIENRL
ncbi:MAG TPA: hypothetical protein PK941_11420 [Paludibacter sp.]|jgi:hypothetical protein|nr:hypothetical protein [Paludibacter sp.]